MNDLNMYTSINNSKSHGLHYLRRSMALRIVSYYSEMPEEIRKHFCCRCCNTSMEKYVYAKVSKEQMEKALATLSGLEEAPSKTMFDLEGSTQ